MAGGGSARCSGCGAVSLALFVRTRTRPGQRDLPHVGRVEVNITTPVWVKQQGNQAMREADEPGSSQ